MKKYFTTAFLFLFVMMATIGVNAQEVEVRTTEEIINEIRVDLKIAETVEINPSLVKIALIEELGDSVMEAYLGNSIMHDQMVEYYGGADSETLFKLHVQIGQDYLKGYPITMRSFMVFNDQTSTYPSRSGGMFRTSDNSSYGYGGMMGRIGRSNTGYGGMMGTYDAYDDGDQSNFRFGRMGRNFNTSNARLVYGTSADNGYGNYGMMNNFGWGGMIMGMLGFILLIVVIVYLFSSNSRNHVFSNSNNALNIAKERYASGEITREEFLQMTSTLR